MAAESGLVKKLAAVMSAVKRIPKNGRNTFHGYDYATEGDIVAAIREELAQRSVMLFPGITGRNREPVGEKGQILTHLEMEFTFIDGETGESLTRPWLGAGTDKEDKGAYKAMTGGEKYFLLKTFLIPTGDDPEAEEQPKPRPQAPAPARHEQAPPARPAASETHAAPEGDGVVGVQNIKVGKKGRSAKGEWTLWIVTLSDGREVKTFDDDLAVKVTDAKRAGARIRVSVDGDGKLTKIAA